MYTYTFGKEQIVSITGDGSFMNAVTEGTFCLKLRDNSSKIYIVVAADISKRIDVSGTFPCSGHVDITFDLQIA